MGNLSTLDEPATRVRLVPGRGKTAREVVALLETIRQETQEHRFWTGVKGIVADGDHVDVEWFDPIWTRPLGTGSTRQSSVTSSR